MKKKRALIIGSGGLRGAYDAGVAAELCRNLEHSYFDSIYACSAGAYTAAYVATNQPDALEHMWRYDLDGRKFVNFQNPLRGRNSLDLEYLIDLMSRPRTLLDRKYLQSSSSRLIYALTQKINGETAYIAPSHNDVFLLMTASAAIPFLHKAVAIGKTRYIDGSLSDPLPFKKALADGHDEIIIVYNKAKGFLDGKGYDSLMDIIALALPGHMRRFAKTLKARFEETEEQLEKLKQVKVIRPKIQLPLKSILDSNKARLNACVDMGIADAKEFLKTYHG